MIIALSLLGAILAVGWILLSLFAEHGTYRWVVGTLAGPAPIFAVILRPRNQEFVRFEVVVLGRAIWVNW